MHARIRRQLVEGMVKEYDVEMVKSLMNTISETTGVTYLEASDMVVTAWQQSKHNSVVSNQPENAKFEELRCAELVA